MLVLLGYLGFLCLKAYKFAYSAQLYKIQFIGLRLIKKIIYCKNTYFILPKLNYLN